MAVDLPFRLLPPATAIAHAEPLPYTDRERQLLRCAKRHPRCVRAGWQPIRSHVRKIAETTRGDEHAPALLLISRQVAASNARRPLRISASEAATVEAPNLPFANVCEARPRRSVSQAHPD